MPHHNPFHLHLTLQPIQQGFGVLALQFRADTNPIDDFIVDFALFHKSGKALVSQRLQGFCRTVSGGDRDRGNPADLGNPIPVTVRARPDGRLRPGGGR